MRSNYGDEKNGSKRGKGYSIVFVSDRTEKVHTIRLTRISLAIIILIAAALTAALAGHLVHGALLRKSYEERIETLNEDISVLAEDKIKLEAEIDELKEKK